MLNRKQTIQILVLLARPAAAITVAVIAILFISQQINGITESAKERRTLYAILQRRTETVDKIKADINLAGDTNIKKLEDAFPLSDNIIDFIVSLDNIAAKNTVKQTMNFGTPTPFFKKGDGATAISIASITYGTNVTSGISALI